jgi:cytochrome b561
LRRPGFPSIARPFFRRSVERFVHGAASTHATNPPPQEGLVVKPVSPSSFPVAPPRRHPALTIALHWLSALAVATALAVAWTRAGLDDPQPRAALMQVHQAAGLLVLALLLLRVATRLATWRSQPRHGLPKAMQLAALATHLLLYGLLLAMPLLGWALTNAHGHDVRLPGLPPLPALVDADPDLADSLDAWHVGLSWVLLSAAVLHAAAALFHHFVRRDEVLRAMLPAAPPAQAGRRRPQSAAGPRESRSF